MRTDRRGVRLANRPGNVRIPAAPVPCVPEGHGRPLPRRVTPTYGLALPVPGTPSARMPRLFLSLFIVFVACLVGCGLNERERAVAAANDAIHQVEEAGLVVAAAIDELPDRALETGDFGVVRSSLRTYVERMELLNAALRELGGQFAPIEPYLAGTFRPAAEAEGIEDRVFRLIAVDAILDNEVVILSDLRANGVDLKKMRAGIKH